MLTSLDTQNPELYPTPLVLSTRELSASLIPSAAMAFTSTPVELSTLSWRLVGMALAVAVAVADSASPSDSTSAGGIYFT